MEVSGCWFPSYFHPSSLVFNRGKKLKQLVYNRSVVKTKQSKKLYHTLSHRYFWYCIFHLMIGTELFKIIFKTTLYIKLKEMQINRKSEMKMQFLVAIQNTVNILLPNHQVLQ